MTYENFKKALKGAKTGDSITFDWNGNSDAPAKKNCTGKISVYEDTYCVCSDDIGSGYIPRDRLGYEKSWLVVTEYASTEYASKDFDNLKLVKSNPKYMKIPKVGDHVEGWEKLNPLPLLPADKQTPPLKIGEKFVVVESDGLPQLPNGSIVELRHDDGDYRPGFLNSAGSDVTYYFLSRLARLPTGHKDKPKAVSTKPKWTDTTPHTDNQLTLEIGTRKATIFHDKGNFVRCEYSGLPPSYKKEDWAFLQKVARKISEFK